MTSDKLFMLSINQKESLKKYTMPEIKSINEIAFI